MIATRRRTIAFPGRPALEAALASVSLTMPPRGSVVNWGLRRLSLRERAFFRGAKDDKTIHPTDWLAWAIVAFRAARRFERPPKVISLWPGARARYPAGRGCDSQIRHDFTVGANLHQPETTMKSAVKYQKPGTVPPTPRPCKSPTKKWPSWPAASSRTSSTRSTKSKREPRSKRWPPITTNSPTTPTRKRGPNTSNSTARPTKRTPPRPSTRSRRMTRRRSRPTKKNCRRPSRSGQHRRLFGRLILQ
jgi:hypothetical protein